MELQSAKFEYTMPDNRIYYARWSLNKEKIYSNLKFEISVYKGGCYAVSYYTDNRICDKNSKEFINAYFKSLQTKQS